MHMFLFLPDIRGPPRHQHGVYWAEVPHPSLPHYHGIRRHHIQLDCHPCRLWLLQGGWRGGPASQISPQDVCTNNRVESKESKIKIVRLTNFKQLTVLILSYFLNVKYVIAGGKISRSWSWSSIVGIVPPVHPSYFKWYSALVLEGEEESGRQKRSGQSEILACFPFMPLPSQGGCTLIGPAILEPIGVKQLYSPPLCNLIAKARSLLITPIFKKWFLKAS